MHPRTLRDRLPLAGLMLVLAASLAGTATAATPQFDAALQQSLQEHKPLVLDFYTDW